MNMITPTDRATGGRWARTPRHRAKAAAAVTSAPSVHVHNNRYSYIVPLVRATDTTAATTVIPSMTRRLRATRSRRRSATAAAISTGTSNSGTSVVRVSVIEPSNPMRRVPVTQSGTIAS